MKWIAMKSAKDIQDPKMAINDFGDPLIFP